MRRCEPALFHSVVFITEEKQTVPYILREKCNLFTANASIALAFVIVRVLQVEILMEDCCCCPDFLPEALTTLNFEMADH